MSILLKPNALQKERLAESRAAWQPPGASIEIRGRAIPGGMIYVGPHLRALSPYFPGEPALIDPTLKIRQRKQPAYPSFGHWHLQSYRSLTVYDRAAYLDWLANGRPGGSHQQELKLFLYGLERRIFFDARFDEQAQAELPLLMSEIDRLTADARKVRDQWAISTLTVLKAAACSRLPGFDFTTLEPPMVNTGWEMPISLVLVLGMCSLEQRPLPAIWAYSWAVCSPQAYLRTVERRCPEEFAQYFELEYHREFGEGIVLPYVQNELSLAYQPLSPGFHKPQPIGPRHLPMIGAPVGYANLIELIERVSAELKDFAYFTFPSSETPLSAYGLLPRALDTLASNPRIAPLIATLDAALAGNSFGMMSKSTLLEHFPETGQQPTPKQTMGIASLAESIGFGIEPDPATLRTPFLRAEEISIYRQEPDPEDGTALRDPDTLLALLSLWSYIAASDGPIEERTAQKACSVLIAQSEPLHIDRNRLHAQAAWLARSPATLAEARRRFGSPDNWETVEIAWMMVTLAHIDATMTPARIKALAKIYGLLGSTSERLHADLHRFSTSAPAPEQIIAGEPIVGFGIPVAPDPHDVTLDATRLASVREQTDAISSVLHDVFAETEAIEPSTTGEPRRPPASDPYLQLLTLLARQPSWSMSELAELAASAGLMAAGAIETINDRAIELELEPPIECDDDICEIDQSILKELLAHD